MSGQGHETIRSPLSRARGSGAAHDGVKAWKTLRVSAAFNVPLLVWFVWSIVSLRAASFEVVSAWLASPVNAILMILLTGSLFVHAALGMREIVEDYVHQPGHKLLKLAALKGLFLAGAVVCVFSILKVAL